MALIFCYEQGILHQVDLSIAGNFSLHQPTNITFPYVAKYQI